MFSFNSLRTLVATSLLALAAAAPAKELPSLELFRDPEITKLFESLPVQEGGRIKPLLKMANVRLQSSRALQSIWLTEDGERGGKPLVDPVTQKPITQDGKPVKLNSVQWLLMSWFRPDIGRTVPLFKVDNSSAVAELGLDTRGKRDQYTFKEIEPAREVLMKKMSEYRQLPTKEQTPEQRIIVQLAAKFLDYDMIMGHFDFIRSPVGDQVDTLPATIPRPLRLSQSLPAVVDAINSGGAPMQIPWFRDFAQAALGAMMSGNPESQLRIFPPADPAVEVWNGPGEMIFGAVSGNAKPTPEQLEWLAQYEEVYLALPDAAKFKAAAQNLVNKVQAAAEKRGEADHIKLELHSIKADYFFYAQWLFLLGMVCVGLTWVAPGSRLDKTAKLLAWVLLGVATVLAITGVTVRCIIMQRPPIATLYETILFIGASCALFGLIAEWITKRGLGLLVAGLAGGGCMFLSIQFDTADASDNLQQLQAVLITNFWLSTHVPIINLGYAACMVAALVSMIYFIQRLFGVITTGSDDARFMTRTAYGFVCFGLLLSLVGTVLGGIWANYSWGRFWGWDPKENGALMIVLMCLVMLHARMGGYIREIGLHCCSLILGCIVIFSWFGVNQLGVGLHAYGFTDGTWPKIYAFWGSQMVLLLYGIILAYREGKKRPTDKQAAA